MIASSTGTVLSYATSLTSISIDVVLVIILVLVGAGFATWFGKSRTIAFLISLAGGLVLYTTFPYYEQVVDWFGVEEQTLYFNSALYLVFTILFFAGVRTIVDVRYPAEKLSRYLQILVISLFFAGLLLVVFYHVTPLESKIALSRPLAMVFAPAEALFWWFGSFTLAMIAYLRG